MALNIQITPGTGDVVAADDISLVKFQKVKINTGAAGIDSPAKDATAGDAAAGAGILAIQPYAFNGATFDRLQADASKNLKTVVNVALPAGANTIGNIGINAGTNKIGTVTLVPATSGGLTVKRLLSAATTNATSVKASAGQVYGWYITNTNAATRFFRLYDLAVAPTVGTSTIFMTIPIPPIVNGGASEISFEQGILMSTGIAFSITAAVGDADTTAVAANEVVVNLLYL